MNPTIGRIVHYNCLPEEQEKYNNYGETAPAVIVRVWSNNVANLKVITDGPQDMWKTSVPMGTSPGQWQWPVIAVPSDAAQAGNAVADDVASAQG